MQGMKKPRRYRPGTVALHTLLYLSCEHGRTVNSLLKGVERTSTLLRLNVLIKKATQQREKVNYLKNTQHNGLGW